MAYQMVLFKIKTKGSHERASSIGLESTHNKNDEQGAVILTAYFMALLKKIKKKLLYEMANWLG